MEYGSDAAIVRRERNRVRAASEKIEADIIRSRNSIEPSPYSGCFITILYIVGGVLFIAFGIFFTKN
jgi:hypothetical protein